MVHLLASRTFSSKSKGSSAVFVGNLSLSPRLAHQNWKPCTYSKVTLAICHSMGALFISVSFIVCMTLLIVGVPRMTGILVEKPAGVIQDENDLLFIIVEACL